MWESILLFLVLDPHGLSRVSVSELDQQHQTDAPDRMWIPPETCQIALHPLLNIDSEHQGPSLHRAGILGAGQRLSDLSLPRNYTNLGDSVVDISFGNALIIKWPRYSYSPGGLPPGGSCKRTSFNLARTKNRLIP